jgi:hypothetical protein
VPTLVVTCIYPCCLGIADLEVRTGGQALRITPFFTHPRSLRLWFSPGEPDHAVMRSAIGPAVQPCVLNRGDPMVLGTIVLCGGVSVVAGSLGAALAGAPGRSRTIDLHQGHGRAGDDRALRRGVPGVSPAGAFHHPQVGPASPMRLPSLVRRCVARRSGEMKPCYRSLCLISLSLLLCSCTALPLQQPPTPAHGSPGSSPKGNPRGEHNV